MALGNWQLWQKVSSPQDWASVEQSLSSVDVEGRIENEGEFAYKDMWPLKDLGEGREREEMCSWG